MAALAQPLTPTPPPAERLLKSVVKKARDRFYGIKLTPGEKRLYRAILIQALKDLTYDPSAIRDPKERAEAEDALQDAREFFTHLGRASDLMALCELCQLDYSTVVETISRSQPEQIRRRMMQAIRIHAMGCKGVGPCLVTESRDGDEIRPEAHARAAKPHDGAHPRRPAGPLPGRQRG